MSRPRLIFIVLLSGLSLVWAALAFTGYNTRFDHRGILRDIRTGQELPKPAQLKKAIADYESTIASVPCNRSLADDYALLLAQSADSAVEAGDDDTALEKMQQGLAAHLACSPTDGKAWLDFAEVTTYREGLTKRTREAYAMSQRVAPGESWLAEKRLLFALRFRPLIDAEARRIVAQDIEVLDRAHPNRIGTVMNAAGVKDVDGLIALFASTAHAAIAE